MSIAAEQVKKFGLNPDNANDCAAVTAVLAYNRNLTDEHFSFEGKFKLSEFKGGQHFISVQVWMKLFPVVECMYDDRYYCIPSYITDNECCYFFVKEIY